MKALSLSHRKQENHQRRRKVNRVLEEEIERRYPHTGKVEDLVETRRQEFREGYEFARKRFIQLSEDLADQSNCMMGIGDGSGQLFVHGDYESIKHLQAKLDRLRELERKMQQIEEFYENFRKA